MPRVTQKDVAERLGLHPTAVCMALKHHPRISEATRELVFKTARAMGYERDPMLGALAAYRRSTRPRSFHGVLAWLVDSSDGYAWNQIPEYREFHRGAVDRAQELGYKIEIFDLRRYSGAKSDRLERVLRSRNIRGMLICSQPRPNTVLPIEFSELAAVVFGYTVRSPALHAVTSHHYQSVVEIYRRLRLRGYQRIGYAFSALHDERLQRHPLSGFLTEQLSQRAEHRVPPCRTESREGLKAWLQRHKPDALITSRNDFPDRLRELRVQIPRQLGVALLGVMDGWREFSGIDEGSHEVGQVAAELVIGMVERGEKGIPRRPRRVLVSGVWWEGRSLRPSSELESMPAGEPLLMEAAP